MAAMRICKIVPMLLMIVWLKDLQLIAAAESCAQENQWCNERPCCQANNSCDYYNFGIRVCRLKQAGCAQLGEVCTSPNLCCNPRHGCAPDGSVRRCREYSSGRPRPTRP